MSERSSRPLTRGNYPVSLLDFQLSGAAMHIKSLAFMALVAVAPYAYSDANVDANVSNPVDVDSNNSGPITATATASAGTGTASAYANMNTGILRTRAIGSGTPVLRQTLATASPFRQAVQVPRTFNGSSTVRFRLVNPTRPRTATSRSTSTQLKQLTPTS